MNERYSGVLIFISATAADRATKYLALSGYEPFARNLHLNFGISFSLLERHATLGLFAALAGAVLLGCICVKSAAFRSAPGIPLLWAGAVSNLIDRVFYGYVIDWIHVALFINLADIWLCLGGLQLLRFSLSFSSEK
ncbi:MAG: signal peptidase II [Synergistaceae bacterium]|jgi:signal peptidase II|nr:signal peptidase II [Synergistaceae bacterium]